MAFTIDESFLPATLTAHPMTDVQFAQFCEEHPDLCFEMTSEGELIVMAPNFSLTGFRNNKICHQLEAWSVKDERGCAGDSSTGYVLPNGARRSPDASWVTKQQIQQLPQTSLLGFWHLCPAFVIELKSESDRLPVLRKKMREYIVNGAQLGWLIDPETRSVEIYRANAEPQFLAEIDTLSGEGPVAGFVLNLLPVWNPLQ